MPNPDSDGGAEPPTTDNAAEPPTPPGGGGETQPFVTIKHIEAAQRRLRGWAFLRPIKRTPMLLSDPLSRDTGAEIWLKLETCQVTKAFKERGALNWLLLHRREARQRGIIAASAGNHAQGVARHAKRLGIRATIVMPKDTPGVKVNGTKRWDAEVVLHGKSFDDAKAHAEELCAQRNLMFVHPFDDADIIAGQGTVALEMLEAAPDLDVLIVPIGGGGLIAGAAIAAKARRPKIHIVGVQVEAFACYRARKTGAPIPNEPTQTIADGIAVKTIGSLSFGLFEPLVDAVIEVSEEEAIAAIVRYNRIGIVTEGAGAVALAALLKAPDLFRGKKCGLIVSGANIDPAKHRTMIADSAPATNASTFKAKDASRTGPRLIDNPAVQRPAPDIARGQQGPGRDAPH